MTAKKKTRDHIVKECHAALNAPAARGARPHGTCDPGCCDAVVEALECQREHLVNALRDNIDAELACVACCQPPPPDDGGAP